MGFSMFYTRVWTWLKGASPQHKIAVQSTQKGDSRVALSGRAPDPFTETDYQELLIDRMDRLLAMQPSRKDLLTLELLRHTIETDQLELPRMPWLAQQLMTLEIDGPEDSYQIAELLKQDRDITACVMEAANGARFGVQPARSLELAIVRLGLQTVQQIAIGVSAHKVIYKISGYNEEANSLAQTALECGQTCQRLARANHLEPGVAFLSGLFHDVGKVLLLRALSQVQEQLGTTQADPMLIHRLNQRMHVVLGAWFAQARGLPIEVCEAIMFHHAPIDGLSGMVWAVQALQRDPAHSGASWEELAPSIASVREVLFSIREAA